MPLYKVADNTDTVYASDVDQLVDALAGNNDVGNITAFSPISAPGAPAVAVNTTAGNLTGAFQYAVAHLTGYWKGQSGTGTLNTQGNTGGGTASATVSPSAQQVNATNIPIGPTGTVARILYRTKANGSTFYQLTEISDNTTTSFTDNIADTSLGVQMPTTNTTGSKFVGDGSGLTNLPLPTIVGGTGISATASGSTETISLTAATTTALGGIKAGSGVNVAGDGTISANPASIGAIATTAEGVANGVATLDGTGNVPTSQLGNAPSPSKAKVSDSLLTTTAATVVTSFTPTAQGNFLVAVSVRVVTAATNVTVTVTWTDGTGAQTNTLLSTASLGVGTHAIQYPLFINATTASAIAVNVTAGTANQVYASASIVGV